MLGGGRSAQGVSTAVGAEAGEGGRGGDREEVAAASQPGGGDT